MLAYELVKLGVDINHMNIKGQFALKHAVSKRNFKEINNLIDHGADINKKDNELWSLLHIAVNSSVPNTEANFDLERLLIKKGIDMNEIDIRGWTPLHYAFIKIGNP